MPADPPIDRFQARLAALVGSPPLEQAPIPRQVELALTGADPARFTVDMSEATVEPRHGMASPLAIQVPRRSFEALAGGGLADWLAAYDKGVVRLQGDPTKVEMLEVYIERVVRPQV